jgi:purine-binding chemotaxis protein CheW
MDSPDHIVTFRLEGWACALPLDDVECVVHAVAITPLPRAPETVLGIINVHGTILPVYDLRRRLRLPPRGLELSDQFIVARTVQRPVALVVDSVEGVLECTEGRVPAGAVLPGLDGVAGVVKRPDGIILIHDLDRFLSQAEDQALREALTQRGAS